MAPAPTETKVAALVEEFVIVPPSTPAVSVALVLESELTIWTPPLRSSVPPTFTTASWPVVPTPTANVFVAPESSFTVPWLTVSRPVKGVRVVSERTPAPAFVRPAEPVSVLEMVEVSVAVAVGV